MSLIPDWAPNIHPLLVHFPIALLFGAVLLDLVSLIRHRNKGLRSAAAVVYVIGALSVLVTYLSGQQAADTVTLSGAANTVLTEHADWAEWTLWYFGIYALVRLAGLLWFNRDGKIAASLPLFVLGAAGLFLLWETTEHGSQMVYRYGVGVQAVAKLDALVHAQQAELDRFVVRDEAPQVEENGSWRWTPGGRAPSVLASSFRWLEGDTTLVAPATREAGGRGAVLALQASEEPAFFVFDHPMRSIQADVTLNLEDFDGMFTLAHHVQDAANYHFLTVENGTLKEGRVANGEMEVMDEKPFNAAGWHTLRVVGDQTHFRGYADGSLITHGHGPAPAPGPFGLRVAGTGTVLLGRIDVQELR